MDGEHGPKAIGVRIGIGAFARLSGMSIPRLRRYHEAGLLVPADVDPTSGYRTYTRAQLVPARTLDRLRRADLPVSELTAAMSGDAGVRLETLRAHRRRLEDRLAADQRMIELVDQMIREERMHVTNERFQVMELVIRVPDVESTIVFYRDVLGFDFEPSDHEGAPLHYNASGGAWDPDGFFLFTIFQADDWATKSEFGFDVDDVDEVWARAGKYEGAQLAPPKALLGLAPHLGEANVPTQAIIADPAGNRINLYQQVGDT